MSCYHKDTAVFLPPPSHFNDTFFGVVFFSCPLSLFLIYEKECCLWVPYVEVSH